MPVHLPRKVIPISATKLALDDIVTIYERLVLQVTEQAEREIANLTKSTNQTDDEFAAYKVRARENAFKITVTISGRNGESLFGEDASIFRSPNRPEKIRGIFLTNVTSYQTFATVRPVNSFELNFDFSKPPLLDANSSLSAPTKNLSNLTVQGDRESWVAAISDAVMAMVGARKTHSFWIHRAFAYDFGLWLLAFPFAFYLCWKAYPVISRFLTPVHNVVSGAAYVYLVVITVWAYRCLFGYTKWAFPTVELADNHDAAVTHRTIWGLIIVGLITNLIWEMLH